MGMWDGGGGEQSKEQFAVIFRQGRLGHRTELAGPYLAPFLQSLAQMPWSYLRTSRRCSNFSSLSAFRPSKYEQRH